MRISWNVIDTIILLFLPLLCTAGLIFSSYLFRYEIQEWWNHPKVKTPSELISSLSINQIECIKQVTVIDSLVYVNNQKNNGLITIGYVISDEYKAAIFVNSNNKCLLEYNKSLTLGKYEHIKEFNGMFIDIKWFDFTGDGMKDVYIWFNDYHSRINGGVHIFDAKQINNSYKNILRLKLCRDWSSVKFSGTDPMLIVSDYEICSDYIDDPPSKPIYYKISLDNEGSKVIKD